MNQRMLWFLTVLLGCSALGLKCPIRGDAMDIPVPRLKIHLKNATVMDALTKLSRDMGVGFVCTQLATERKDFVLQDVDEQTALEIFATTYGCNVVDWGYVLVVAPAVGKKALQPKKWLYPLLAEFIHIDVDANASAEKYSRAISRARREMEQQCSQRLKHELNALAQPGKDLYIPVSALSEPAQTLVRKFVSYDLAQEIVFSTTAFRRGDRKTDSRRQIISLHSCDRVPTLKRFIFSTFHFRSFIPPWSWYAKRVPAVRKMGMRVMMQYEFQPKRVDALLNASVTLKLTAVKLENLLAKLGESLNISFSLHEKLQLHPQIHISVKDCPLWAVLDSISLLTGEFWVPACDSLKYEFKKPETFLERAFESAPIEWRAHILRKLYNRHNQYKMDFWSLYAWTLLPPKTRVQMEKAPISASKLSKGVMRCLRNAHRYNGITIHTWALIDYPCTFVVGLKPSKAFARGDAQKPLTFSITLIPELEKWSYSALNDLRRIVLADCRSLWHKRIYATYIPKDYKPPPLLKIPPPPKDVTFPPPIYFQHFKCMRKNQ